MENTYDTTFNDTQCPPSGPRDAKIVIVGEAPGEHEVLAKTPFVGPSGRLLDRLLQSVGISREECYFTNVVKSRPPENDFGHFYELTKKGKLDSKRHRPTPFLLSSVDQLKNELETLSPNIIIALGNEPLRALTSCRGILKWRGSLLSSHSKVKLIGTVHPAAILREYKYLPIVQFDLKRAALEAKTPELILPRMDFVVQPTYSQAIQFLRRKHSRIAFDIETIENHVRCIAFSSAVGTAICIPFICTGDKDGANSTIRVLRKATETKLQSYWSLEEEYLILEAMNDLFLDESCVKIAQNFPFDSTVLANEFGFDVRGQIEDTMLKHHCVYSELPKGLDFLCSIYTRIPYYSDYAVSSDTSTWTYNCYDAAVTFEVEAVEHKELLESGQSDVYYKDKIPTMLAMTRAQNRGIEINVEERTKQRLEIEAKRNKLEAEIRTLSGVADLNVSSPKQMSSLLYTRLGLPTQLHHKTKNVTVGKDAMEALAKKFPVHKTLFDAIRSHSSCETLLDGFYAKELGSDGRLRTSYNTAGTSTDRLTSSESFLYPSTNLQNIQRASAGPMRRCFVPSKGRKLLKADLSQAEFRIVVWLARIERLIQRYITNPDFDVHTWVASLIFKISEELIGKDSQERSTAKNGVYGGNYKMHYITAARTYKLALHEAKFVLEEYRKAIPEVPMWWTEVEECIKKTRSITSPFGNRRIFFGRMDDDTFRQAYSHSAQTVVAHTMNRAAVLCDELFDPYECPLLLQVHDELVFEPLEEHAEKYAEAVKSIMEVPIRFPGVKEPLVIPADVSIGDSWMDQQKVKFK